MTSGRFMLLKAIDRTQLCEHTYIDCQQSVNIFAAFFRQWWSTKSWLTAAAAWAQPSRRTPWLRSVPSSYLKSCPRHFEGESYNQNLKKSVNRLAPQTLTNPWPIQMPVILAGSEETKKKYLGRMTEVISGRACLECRWSSYFIFHTFLRVHSNIIFPRIVWKLWSQFN